MIKSQISKFSAQGGSASGGKFQNLRAFTLIEMLVVVVILIMLSGIVLGYGLRRGDASQRLDRSTQKLVSDLERIREMSLNKNCGEPPVICVYGVHIDKNNPTKYVLFSSNSYVVLTSGTIVAPEMTILDTINLESGVAFSFNDGSSILTDNNNMVFLIDKGQSNYGELFIVKFAPPDIIPPDIAIKKINLLNNRGEIRSIMLSPYYFEIR